MILVLGDRDSLRTTGYGNYCSLVVSYFGKHAVKGRSTKEEGVEIKLD